MFQLWTSEPVFALQERHRAPGSFAMAQHDRQ